MNIRKYSTAILLTLVALILAPLAAPVYAADPIKAGHDPAIGTKVRVSPTTELTLLAVEDNKYTWNAKITPQTTLASGADIDTTWHYDDKTAQWVAGANLFDAVVDGNEVTVSCNGESATWRPSVTLADKLLLILPNDKVLSPSSASLLPVDPWNEHYFGNTLQWSYGSGVTRNVRIIEGLIQEYYTVDKPLDCDLIIRANLDTTKGYEWSRPLSAWGSDNEPVALVIDGDTATLPADSAAVYPVTIDPDSSFASIAADGYIDRSDDGNYADDEATWNTIHDAASGESVTSSGVTTIYAGVGTRAGAGDIDYIRIYRGYVYFDTSELTAAVNITAASIGIRASYIQRELDSSWYLRVQHNATYPGSTLVGSDYDNAKWGSTYYGTATISSGTSNYVPIPLTQAGISLITRGGTTKFVLREGNYDVADSLPFFYDGDYCFNRITFYSYEQGTGYWPYLNVTYQASGEPVLATIDASNVANSTARLNAYVYSSGGELCDVRFQYGNVTATYTDATAWVNDTYDTGAYPYADLTGLDNDTEYFFRVQVGNSAGVVSGTELSFTTEGSINEPTGLLAVASGNDVSLSWARGTGATQTLVRGKVGSYPTSTTDGSLVYLGTGGSAIHPDLVIGSTYYYTAWGESGGVYSDNTTQATVTTGFPVTETDTPGTPSSPEGWWSEPDESPLSDLPLYTELTGVITDYGMQATTGWMLVFLAVIVLCTAAAYGLTNGNVMIAGIACALLFMGFSVVHLLPMWMMGFSLVIFVSMAIIRERA